MAKHSIEPAIKEAFAAVRHAQDVRRMHARETPKGNQQREADLEFARERLRRAMVPLRSFLGAAPYKPQTAPFVEVTARVTQASKSIQAERRKLWKMQDRKND